MRHDFLDDMEEGDPCPDCRVGALECRTDGKDCTCWICAPCTPCVEDGLICDACGWRKSDGASKEWQTERRLLAGLAAVPAAERVASMDVFAELFADGD